MAKKGRFIGRRREGRKEGKEAASRAMEYGGESIPQEIVSEQAHYSYDWPTAGGNNRRDGGSTTTIKPPLKRLWRSRDVVNPKGGIVISNGIAVCGEWSRGSMRSFIHGVNIEDGAKIWGYSTWGMIMGWPAISGPYVYVGRSSSAICLELATGKEIWKADSGEPSSDDLPIAAIGCPLCAGQMVVFRDEKIRGFHPLTGQELFQVDGSNDPRENVGPCSDGTSLYVPGHREIVRADLRELKVVAQAYTNGKITAGPVLAENLLVFSTNRCTVEALNAESLEHVWSFTMEGRELHSVGMDSACAYARGMVFVGALDGNFYGLEAKSGARVWKRRIGEVVETSPIVCGDVVYLNASGKGLCGFDLLTGKPLCEEHFWEEEYQMGVTGLAVSGSILLAGADRLCAFSSK